MMKTYPSYLAVMALLLLMTPEPSHSISVNWTQVDGPEMLIVSVGASGVWAVGTDLRVYYRTGTYQNPCSIGQEWLNIPGLLLQHLDVGKDVVFGTDSGRNLYYRSGITSCRPEGVGWTEVETDPILASRSTVSDKGHVWLTSPLTTAYRRKGANNCFPPGEEFQQLSNGFTGISAGPAGVWATGGQNLFYRTDTRGDPQTAGTAWQLVANGVLRVSSGHDLVAVIQLDNSVALRQCISEENPTGTKWTLLPDQTLNELDHYHNTVWGIGTSGVVYQGKIFDCPEGEEDDCDDM